MDELTTPCEYLEASDHWRSGCGNTACPVRRGGADAVKSPSDMQEAACGEALLLEPFVISALLYTFFIGRLV
jgi:hypothetical protein